MFLFYLFFFQKTKGLNDIALLRVSKDIEFNDYVQPIKLASEDYIIDPKAIFTVSGWGKLNVRFSTIE